MLPFSSHPPWSLSSGHLLHCLGGLLCRDLPCRLGRMDLLFCQCQEEQRILACLKTSFIWHKLLWIVTHFVRCTRKGPRWKVSIYAREGRTPEISLEAQRMGLKLGTSLQEHTLLPSSSEAEFQYVIRSPEMALQGPYASSPSAFVLHS